MADILAMSNPLSVRTVRQRQTGERIAGMWRYRQGQGLFRLLKDHGIVTCVRSASELLGAATLRSAKTANNR
ncbi:MAG TPA: hypothetical protein VGA50_03735, partial [Kiloniellales bacterium]